jgi:drug/metabolite transporter (DMT)-like permease
MVPAARGTAISNTQVLFAIVFGSLLFNEKPSNWTLLGASIIITALIILARTKQYIAKSGN